MRYKINFKKSEKSEIKKIFKEALSEYGFISTRKKTHTNLLKQNYLFYGSYYGYNLKETVVEYKNRYYGLVLIEINLEGHNYSFYFKKVCTDFYQASHAGFEASRMQNPLIEHEKEQKNIIIRIVNKFAELVFRKAA